MDEIDVDEEEGDGWAFEYKLQDFTSIKYLSTQFDQLLKPMLANEVFFERHFISNESVLRLKADDLAVSEVYSFKGKM